RPLPLDDDQILPWGSTAAQNRVISRPDSRNPVLFPNRWILQFRPSPDHGWISLYTLSPVEFTPKDFEIMNFSTSTKKTSFFTYEVMVTKMLLGEGVEK